MYKNYCVTPVLRASPVFYIQYFDVKVDLLLRGRHIEFRQAHQPKNSFIWPSNWLKRYFLVGLIRL
jgi:hypothetical protein